RIPCSRCRRALRVPAELIGRKVACKFCDQTFRADPGRVLLRDETELRADSGTGIRRPGSPVAASSGWARSRSSSDSSWGGYPAAAGWEDRRGRGLGRHPGHLAATAVGTTPGPATLAPAADDELDEWLDRLSSGEMAAGAEGAGSSWRAGSEPS